MRWLNGCRRVIVGCVVLAASTAGAEAIRSQVLRQADGKWELLRDGQPYFIKGAGGDQSKALLKAMGGNSVRTWGTDNLGPQLDEAQRLGLSVTVGIWLAQERAGHFSYNNADDVAGQSQRAREAIEKYKNYPAVLMWGIGNEMEGYGNGDNAAMWSAVNNLAAMAKKIDPDHPTMTVVAEIGGERVKDIERLCPDIDVIGINSYGGLASIPRRYKAAGGTKPYVITEFGPPGPWEVSRDSFGAALEPTSTQKAAVYRRGYEAAIASQSGTCLGSYAFLWGQKQEGTMTWFGMFLADGTRLDPVRTMSELWTGSAAVAGPTMEPIKIAGRDVVAPGATVHANVAATDGAGRPVAMQWQLQREASVHGTGGEAEPAMGTVAGAIGAAEGGAVEVHMPSEPGIYRLFAIARDDAHNGSVANIPLQVRSDALTLADNDDQAVAPASEPATTAPASDFKPMVIYDDGTEKSGYIPAGWMGNTGAIAMDEKCRDDPHDGKMCLKLQYKAGDNFGGIVWQSPANNWGDQVGGFNLTGAKKLTFWARGEDGDEKVQFKFGIIGSDKKYPDTASGQTTVTLSKDWKQYSIDLAGKDLSRIITGFCWVAEGQGSPLTFYVDDVRYE